MKPQYEPKTPEQKLAYLVEESAEVLAAVGKTQRWGLESFNPEIPGDGPGFRETNREWILRELVDLELAIAIVREAFDNGAETDRFRAAKRAVNPQLWERLEKKGLLPR